MFIIVYMPAYYKPTRLLQAGGQMLPRRCQLFAAPFSHMELVERQTGERRSEHSVSTTGPVVRAGWFTL